MQDMKFNNTKKHKEHKNMPHSKNMHNIYLYSWYSFNIFEVQANICERTQIIDSYSVADGLIVQKLFKWRMYVCQSVNQGVGIAIAKYRDV